MSVENILKRHSVEADIQLQVDCFVLNNAKALETADIIEVSNKKLANSKAVYVVEDQVVPANDPKVSEAQQKMAEFAKKHACTYVYGKAMAPYYLLNGAVKAGDVVVGTDPDVAMVGGVGALGICLCPAKMAQALVYGKAQLPQPQVFKVKLTQKLAEGVDIRDAAKQLVVAVKPYVKAETIVEFSEAQAVLTKEEKMLLCGWCQKLGVLAAVFTEEDTLTADYVLELGKVSACGAPEKETAVTVVYLGGNYGGTLAAIKLAAEMVAGKKIAYKVRLNVAPASGAIYAAAANAGYLTTIIEAEGMILNQCALPPVQSRIGAGEVMVSNDIHDEKDYAGKDGIIYLTSTVAAVQAALTGKIGGDK